MLRGLRMISFVVLVSVGSVPKTQGYRWTTTTEMKQVAKKDSSTPNHQQLNRNINTENGNRNDKGSGATVTTVFGRPGRSNLLNSQSLTPDQYYMKLMSMLTSKENVLHGPGKDRVVGRESETDFVDNDEDGDVIELYGSNPYPFSSIESAEKRPYSGRVKALESDSIIPLMRSRPPSGQSEELWDRVADIQNNAGERRLSPETGHVTYRVANLKRGVGPFERRLFMKPYQQRFSSFFG